MLRTEWRRPDTEIGRNTVSVYVLRMWYSKEANSERGGEYCSDMSLVGSSQPIRPQLPTNV